MSRNQASACVLALLTLGSLSCGNSDPTGPVVTINAPPVIESLVAGSPQIETSSDQSIQLTATVTDKETAAAQLAYTWSASPNPGTFTGTGAQVRWKASATLPETTTITLTVIESFTSGGTTKQNAVTSTVQVRYNDLLIAALARQFLTDFGTFAITPAACVRNFSDALCSRGKSDELSDITNNRNRSGVQIQSSTLGTTTVALTNGAGTTAASSTPCVFTDRFANGTTQKAGGTCDITAVYDQSKWWLCESKFNPPFCSNADCPSSFDAGRVLPFSLFDRTLLPPFSHP
jgi:hypothetical protein